MKIYIDESGTFLVPKNGKTKTSSVGALILLEGEEEFVFKEFEMIKSRWGDIKKEYKGSELTESQVNEVILMLKRFNAVLVASVIDMSLQDEEYLKYHQRQQASVFTESLGKVKYESMKNDLRDIEREILSLPSQLYVHSTCLTEVVDDVLRMGTLYFVQRKPEALGKFSWVIDAKNIKENKAERLWRKVITSYIQTRSVQDPYKSIIGADYSYMENFKYEGRPTISPKEIPKGAVEGHDLKKIMKELRFKNSEECLGLQLIDILVTTIRRACDGNLQEEGWSDIGALTLQPRKGTLNSFVLTSLTPIKDVKEKPYFRFMQMSGKKSKQLLVF